MELLGVVKILKEKFVLLKVFDFGVYFFVIYIVLILV